MIAWGLESGNEEILKHARKGTTVQRIEESLTASHKAGIKNWGYFIIGLPGETVETIQQTIALSKRCRSTSRCSTSPRRIPARRSSSRWSRTAGSI